MGREPDQNCRKPLDLLTPTRLNHLDIKSTGGGPEMDEQNKNLILATALSFFVIMVWMFLFPPQEPVVDPNATPTTETAVTGDGLTAPVSGEDAPTATGEIGNLDEGLAALAAAPRVQIDTKELSGSLSLLGGRIDDLKLKSYNETIEDGSPIVTMLTPEGNANAYYALQGWVPSGDVTPDQVPDKNTLWTQDSGGTLTESSPITLSWDNGAGLTFRREISVDDKYMFSITQSVENNSSAAIELYPYSYIARHSEPDTIGFFILHEGVVRLTNGILHEIDYSDMGSLDREEFDEKDSERTKLTESGWIGFTDKNWMTTLIPEQGTSATTITKYYAPQDIYRTELWQAPVTVAAGASAEVKARLFAGAKEWEAIKGYQDAGVTNFIESIDWGWFSYLTKPIFRVLHWLNGLIGNMGWAIIALTLMIKALLLPLAYKSYVSMAKMKELQPQMEKIKESAGEDRQKLQMEMMALYKKEKVNPAAGCLPILLQIPIFFSLYKVIFVTIELRHAAWFGPFQDLSAPDPTSILNFYGLLPWAAPEPSSFLALIFIGILPLILGVSMWLQQKLNPAPTDATQAMIFAWMPWVFMFMLGGFASGLVVYWIANNVITFAQQYLIMRSQGYKPDLFGNIISSFKRTPKSEE